MNAPLPKPVPTIVIAGGSGFLGTSLARHLAARSLKVVILSRHAPRVSGPWAHAAWDARTMGEWARVLDGAAALVNFTGRSVNCIKTPDHCDEILRSRVESTRVLGEACRAVATPPAVWVQMSTAHIYGDPPTDVCDEGSATGFGLAPIVGHAWEAAFGAAKLEGQRGVVMRTGFVIGRDRGCGGGALGTLGALARWGLGGASGNGRQGMSWIHERDLNRFVERAIEDARVSGVYVLSAPKPVSNREFMRELRRAVRWPKVPLGLPAFGWMVRIGAGLVLRTDPELALYGRYVVSRRLREEGFVFEFPEVRGALRDLYHGAAGAG